jgi:diacylglycerol kinase
MRIHFYLASGVIFIGVTLGLSPIEIAILCCVISFVLIAEIVNTTLETNLDFLNGKQFHPTVKTIKDIFASVVLVAVINAIIVGYIIFAPHLTIFENRTPGAIELKRERNIWQEEISEIVKGTVPTTYRDCPRQRLRNQDLKGTVPKRIITARLSQRRLG